MAQDIVQRFLGNPVEGGLHRRGQRWDLLQVHLVGDPAPALHRVQAGLIDQRDQRLAQRRVERGEREAGGKGTWKKVG